MLRLTNSMNQSCPSDDGRVVLRRGTAWHGKAVVGKHLAGPGDVGQHAVEYASALPVAIHAEFEEVPGLLTTLSTSSTLSVLKRSAA